MTTYLPAEEKKDVIADVKFVLAASLLMWSWLKLLPRPKKGDFCQESGETIAVFPFSH